MSGGGGGGNRQDNRQRGNAAQLLEKYKSMARDAQLGGDRVQTEYYLQFADHYFRVLGESRSRFEDQRPRRDEDSDGEDDDNAEMLEHADSGSSRGESDFAQGEPEADERPQRRQARGRDREEGYEPRDRTERGNGRVRDNQREDEGGERIAFDVLPPAIGADEVSAASVGESDDEAPRPKRRPRRPRADDSDTEIAPAA